MAYVCETDQMAELTAELTVIYWHLILVHFNLAIFQIC